MKPWVVAYLSFTAVLVLTPGSTTAVVVRNTLARGRGAGMATAIGAAVANTSLATAAGFGLAVGFSRWPAMLTALRVTGACYLGFLGATSLFRVARHSDGGLQMLAAAPPDLSSPETRHSFRDGVAVNLLNPAIATFYLIVVPSFLPVDAPTWYFAALAAAHIVMALTCHGIWALALDRLRVVLHPAWARRGLEGATGLALIYLAARVLFRA